MNQPVGKRVAARLYLHLAALETAAAGLAARVAAAEALAGLRRGEDFNLARLDLDGPTVALLHYPAFFEDAFPALAASWLVDAGAGTVSHRSYADSLNPPILHRKESMLPADHPLRAGFAALTAACEAVGLFDQPTRIGYQRQWEALVQEKGYRVLGHELLPIGNDEGTEPGADDDATPLHAGWQAARQLTALQRYGFSAPVQSLARYGLLGAGTRVFDYGCGRGDDVRGLRENGIEAAGWDPYFAPDNPIVSADIVNLGFVVNVIEDFDERLCALTRAWSLAERLLVVSVMLANQNDIAGRRFRDGLLTRRGTFQRYYTQAEIRAFLAAALDEEPIAVAPGVLYCFRDKDAEQRFLVDRYRSRRRAPGHLGAPSRQHQPRVRAVRERVAGDAPRVRHDRSEARYLAHREALDRLWGRWLALGRRPDPAEVDDLEALSQGFGSLGRALRFLEGRADAAELDLAVAGRRADLLVYLALNQFERRPAYRHLEPGLQRDIKAMFGDYAGALARARELLFQIAEVPALAAACREAAAAGLGWLEVEPGDEAGRDPASAGVAVAIGSLTLHTGMVDRLPPLLRVYVGCAAVLYGDYRHADLIKVHIGSGKLSLMRYDDFAGGPLPRMLERVKIRLREQDIDYFAYGDAFEPPLLFRKSRFVNEEFPHYPEQLAFDEALEGLGLFDLSGYGPPPQVFAATLARHRWEVAGFELRRATTIPDLDDPCGRFLTYRQLIACGETQARTGLANLPRRPESCNALYDLAVQVLDPVIDWFGMIRLTYGFCSPALARAIPGRIDPRLDQHAAHEVNRLGRVVCPRLGAAVDFIVDDDDMLEVARWVVAHTPFDRLYFYGADLPIHVSFGPQHSRQIVRMLPGQDGRLLPRVVADLG